MSSHTFTWGKPLYISSGHPGARRGYFVLCDDPEQAAARANATAKKRRRIIGPQRHTTFRAARARPGACYRQRLSAATIGSDYRQRLSAATIGSDYRIGGWQVIVPAVLT